MKINKNKIIIIIILIIIERIKIMEKEVRINVSVPDEIHHQLKLEALTERKNLKDKIVEILKNHCKAKVERKT